MKVLLIGNYARDRQQSMLRFAELLRNELLRKGHDVRVAAPEAFFARVSAGAGRVSKLMEYLDKVFCFPLRLSADVRWADVVHICDHSNAFYGKYLRKTPYVVTCHDLYAIRGAIGELPEFKPSRPGGVLQKWNRRELARAPLVVCVSNATQRDFLRVLEPSGESRVVPMSLNADFKVLSQDESRSRLAQYALDGERPYVLNVGSSHRRKNREGLIRVLKHLEERWRGVCVFAGEALTPEHLQLAESLGVSNRIVQIVEPAHELLCALYNGAHATVVPSRYEGFGWPVIEAQACGCPVVAGNDSSIPEVAGDGAILHDPADEAGFAEAILSLCDAAKRHAVIEDGFRNISRFSKSAMIDSYDRAYKEIAGLSGA